MESRKTNPDDPELASSHSEYGAPRPLNLGRKIFLSHSGKDKNFVRFLHKELCRQYCGVKFVFFDEKDLPTAEPISMKNILIEARGCELGILVLSEDFFMHTPNPMLELEALTDNKVRLLPLFYKISVDAFDKMRCDNMWEMRWKEWSVVDQEKIQRWRDALTLVKMYSGLEYCKLATNEDDYIMEIVKKVTNIVRPAISFSEEGVCGMDRLCKIVNNMYNKCALMRSSNGCTQVASTSINVGFEEDCGKTLDLVGIYGFAGLGKTTLCKCLCDFYSAKFHGKVCWIDLGSKPSARISSQEHSLKAYRMRMQHILSRLIGSIVGLDSLEFFQVQNLLRNQISSRIDPIFLAIDNILPSQEFQEEAHFYLSCDFPKGSKIFITSRSEKILEHIAHKYSRFSVVIEHIPKLTSKDAMNIVLHEIPELQALDVEVELEECVIMCIVYQQNERYCLNGNFWYHPLMIKSLAALLKNDRRHEGDWKSRVRELQSIVNVEKSDAWSMVFSVFDLTYKVLKEEEQKVFLDLSLFYMLSSEASCAWIRGVYSHLGEKKVNKILLLLEDLSFINCKNDEIQMHDLMVDFSKHKLLQGAAGFNLMLEDGAHSQDPAFWFLANAAMGADQWPSYPSRSVRTVSISGIRRCDQLECLDLRNLEGVEVLHLENNPGVQEVLLSPITMAHVRSFIVRVALGTTSLLRCTMDEDWSTSSSISASSQCRPRGQVVWVELEGNVILATRRRVQRSWWSNYTVPQSLQSFLQRFDNPSTGSAAPVYDLGLWPSLRNLQYLSLSHVAAQRIDLISITAHLKELELMSMPRLRNIHGLEKSTNLQKLFIKDCAKLVLLNIPASPWLSSDISDCKSLERIYLHTLAHPEADCSDWFDAELEIRTCFALRSVDGIAQYRGWFRFENDPDVRGHGCMQEAIRELLESAEPGSSKFMANVCSLVCDPIDQAGLAGLYVLCVKDAQHVASLTSALMSVAPAICLNCLDIRCREDGDCGCDKNVPRFGPSMPAVFKPGKIYSFLYHCPQVRDLASLSQLGNGITSLNLRGCRSVDEWPDFATMTSLRDLTLSHTSLRELPGGVLLLPSLRSLDIQGCKQLPVEEMIKALTWKGIGYDCACGECLGYNCACASGSLKSLLADLRHHRRDRSCVVDALDSQWPELLALFQEQWRYLCCPTLHPRYPNIVFRGAQLSFLIIIFLYELWFGEVEARQNGGSADSEGLPPSPTMKKMRRLLCSESFMSLPFYDCKIGHRGRIAAKDEGSIVCMAIALIGSASIGCFNASLNEDLKDRVVNFLQAFLNDSPSSTGKALLHLQWSAHIQYWLGLRLRERVQEAVGKIASTLSLAEKLNVELEENFSDVMLARLLIMPEEPEEEEQQQDKF